MRTPAHPLLALLLFAAPMATRAQPATVILVRHAEKASQTENDPVLSDAGTQRAKDLAAALADAHLGAVVITQYQRTRLTAAGVLAAAGLTPVVVTAGGTTHAAEVAEAILKRPAGEVVLVVGHSNTIMPIIAALGGPKLANICDSQYANLYILEMTGSPSPKLIRASYGKADAADSACTNPVK